MSKDEPERMGKTRRQLPERMQGQPMPQPERPTIHYTELPEDTQGPIADEWNFYRREVGRLLAEGHEGKWVLIKGEKIIAIWDTEEQAHEAALQRYLMQPVLIHQVLTREPVFRGPSFLRLRAMARGRR
jgi:hypothetical protein